MSDSDWFTTKDTIETNRIHINMNKKNISLKIGLLIKKILIMKKLTFIMVLIFISELTICQNLVETNKLWSVVECSGFCWTYGYKFDGDTVINGTYYKIMWETTDSTFTNWYYSRAIREEPDGKVYQMGYEVEELLYDFGLEMNDQFISQINGCDIDLLVTSIDTITLLNGEQRKRIIFDDWDVKPWVAGIGSMHGILNVDAQCYCDMYFELNCFTENDTLKYDNPNFEGCYVITVGIHENKSNTWQLSPNPFTDYTNFTFPYLDNNVYEMQIKDLYGRAIRSIKNIYSGEVIIQDQNLNTGIYFFRFFENGQLKFTGKMIKY